jgi:hypothetical protein
MVVFAHFRWIERTFSGARIRKGKGKIIIIIIPIAPVLQTPRSKYLLNSQKHLCRYEGTKRKHHWTQICVKIL